MIKKNIFLKDFSKFFSGAFLAQIIGFLVSPILSRLYRPEDFGYFALFSQILLPLSVLSALSLPLLIPRFKDAGLKVFIFQISMTFTLLLSLLVVLVGGVFDFEFSENAIFQTLWPWLAVGLVLTNLRKFFHFASIGDKKFLFNSKSKILESLFGTGGNVGLGAIGFGFKGLILGNFIGQIIFIITMLFRYGAETKDYFKKKTRESYQSFLKTYKKHVVVQTSNHLIEFSLILVFSLLITKTSSIEGLGYFAFYLKIVNTPLELISDYFSQAVLARTSDFQENAHIRKFLLKGSLLVLAPAIGTIGFMFWFGPQIFSFIFGKEWLESGMIAKYFIIGTMSIFYIRCFQYIPNLKNRHEIYTVFSLLTYGSPVILLIVTSQIGWNFLDSLKLLSAILAFLGIAYFVTLNALLTKTK